MPQIRLERVSKYYPQDKKQMAALQEINLTVEQGEFLFLTGSSGAGKSTLLQLISGDLRPTSGAVFLDDINLTRLSRLRRDRLRLVFGRVPQLSQLSGSPLYYVCSPGHKGHDDLTQSPC